MRLGSAAWFSPPQPGALWGAVVTHRVGTYTGQTQPPLGKRTHSSLIHPVWIRWAVATEVQTEGTFNDEML